MSISIGAALTEAVTRLHSAADLPHLEAELLLCHLLGKPRTWLVAWPGKLLTEEEHDAFNDLIRRRSEGEPVAYITGEREFWSLPLKVSPDTLIPRPETELLVETVLELYGETEQLTLVDMGTGSGAIALAIAREKPAWEIMATDISEAALAVAQRNAAELGIFNVRFMLGDWFEALPPAPVDVIVSNPPYVATGDPHLQQGDVRFEPAVALASGEEGLDDIRRLLPAAIQHLVNGGRILIEHGYEQGEAVRQLMNHHGYRDIHTLRDMQGHERVTVGTYQTIPL